MTSERPGGPGHPEEPERTARATRATADGAGAHAGAGAGTDRAPGGDGEAGVEPVGSRDGSAAPEPAASGGGADTGSAPGGDSGGDGQARISTREAARRLGVKPETLYAYVSRGLLDSRRAQGTRGSTFDPEQIAALARRGRPASSATPSEAPFTGAGTGPASSEHARGGPAAAGAAHPAVESWALVRTGITLIESDRYYFRGVDAVALAEAYGYEEVAEWLWTGELRPGVRFAAAAGPLDSARNAAGGLPAGSGPMDRLRVAVTAAAGADPLRFDLAPQAVLGTARSLIATLVDALPPSSRPERAAAPPASLTAAGPGQRAHRPGREPATDTVGDAPRHPPRTAADDGVPTNGSGSPADRPHPLPMAAGRTTPDGASLARRLWPKLTAAPADDAALRVLDTALVLLVDHDLAASTLAARVAASARAHPYAVVSAGLGALDGPLHGQARALAHRMLTEVAEQGGAGPVVAEYLRAGQRLPGLGHRLYRGEDPRAGALFALLDAVEAAGPALAAARDVAATAATRHDGLHPNVDLALGVLSVSHGMPPQAGETVFAVARTAGWIAHALEEYAEPPLRMRLQGAYRGPRPGQPLPRPSTPD
jgi:citrate synthase